MRSLSNVISGLPHFSCGTIIKGFGRGSKDLGIPTANYPVEVVEKIPKEINTGVYFGWASVDNGEVYKCCLSIGWNPYFNNKHKSMETHILHNFNRDLYGCLLKVCIVGYLRPEQNFESLESLIAAIQKDIDDTKELLEKPENCNFKTHEFFKPNESDTGGHANGHL